MRNRGRFLTNEPSEIHENLSLHASLVQKKSVHGNIPLDFSLIPGPRKARSAELVALANRMWETLSHRNLGAIARFFREAIDLDPGNAEAFTGLANALIAGGMLGITRASVGYSSAEAALQWALEIDPELPAAKCAAAWLKMVSKRDWQSARRGFDAALKHHPACTSCMGGRAMLHIAEGSPKEASALLLEVAQLNALSSLAMALYVWSQYLSREHANVLLQIEQAKASGQYGLVFDAVEALASIQLEDLEAQIERIEAMAADSPRNDVVQGALGYVYSATGQRLRASEILDAMAYREAHEQGHEPYAKAIILVGLNEPQKAVQLLEQSYREGSLWSLGFLSDPILDKLRDNPYYQLFLSKVSYPAHENALPRLGFVS
ncbi:tetratricopeptide repeat protein [Acidicapsa acidisoli]|uniref:tetratricopeptide repeat protein n=1 Tax=Acidicapsa acidisoli TaxID=1615681 RepID=UPI0021E0500E|nr:hypothetical protein [Acidicapsa acidisoli]